MWCGAQGVGGLVSGEPGAATANTVATHSLTHTRHQSGPATTRVCVWRGGVPCLCVCEWEKEWGHGQDQDHRDWDWVVKRGGWVVKHTKHKHWWHQHKRGVGGNTTTTHGHKHTTTLTTN